MARRSSLVARRSSLVAKLKLGLRGSVVLRLARPKLSARPTATLLTVVLMMFVGGHTQVDDAEAVDLVVTRLDDPPPDSCAEADCSLREAIIATNQVPGRDTIFLPAGFYQLSIPGPGENMAAIGDLDIRDELLLVGAGASETVVDGGGLDRVFDILLPNTLAAPTVEIRGVTIQNGIATPIPGGDFVDSSGGGLRVDSRGFVRLVESRVTGNAASTAGGGIHSEAGEFLLPGSLELIRTTVDNNRVPLEGLGGVGGGGIFLEGIATLDMSSIVGNSAALTGGGIYNNGVLEITGSTVSGNTAIIGAGVINLGGSHLQVTDSVISEHTAYSGAGVDGGGTVTIERSMITDNVSDQEGGGFNNGGELTWTITDSTISGNRSGTSGGGLYAGFLSGDYVLVNVTLSGNSAVEGGGAIFLEAGEVSLTNVTMADNASENGASAIRRLSGPIQAQNTIISSSDPGPNCTGLIMSLGHNLEDQNTCMFSSTSDLIDTDPVLGQLVDNGGPTLTHALLPESPAIDAGSDDCPPPAADQRGEVRPVDGDENGSAVCDIGAFEFLPQEPPPTLTSTATAPLPTPTGTPTTTPSLSVPRTSPPSASPTPSPRSEPAATVDRLPDTGTGHVGVSYSERRNWILNGFLISLALASIGGGTLVLRARGR